MKVDVKAEDLRALVAAVAVAADPRESIDLLRNVRLHAAEGSLIATAYSLTWSAEARCPATLVTAGEVGVNLAYLQEVANAAPDAVLGIEVTGSTLTIEAASRWGTPLASWTMKKATGMGGFPAFEWPEVFDEIGQTIDADTLARLGEILYAAEDPHRSPQFGAVQVVSGHAMAGGPFRCAVAQVPGIRDFTLPAPVVRALAATRQTLRLAETEEAHYILVGTSARYRVPRLQVPLNDLYAMYASNAADLTKVTVRAEGSDLLDAIRRVSLADPQSKVITLDVDTYGVTLRAGTDDTAAVASMRATVDMRGAEGCQAKVSAAHLADAIKAAKGPVLLCLPYTGGSMLTVGSETSTGFVLQRA